MEPLCDHLGVNLVLSEGFADRCERRAVRAGEFELRGIAGRPHTSIASHEHEATNTRCRVGWGRCSWRSQLSI